jgi:AAA15 family ATPase/GTPase
MIIDLSVNNFRSFQSEQTLSLNVETSRERHRTNYSVIENGRLAVLRSAAILGANASGKSNLLTAFAALRWMVVSSASRKEGQRILPYEPYRLSKQSAESPVSLQIEFVLPSGIRYKYEISFLEDRVLEERLYSFAKRQRAMLFERGADDTWETIRFGGTYKGGKRRFPFFANAAYLSRAGNDASAPEAMREIRKYFEGWLMIGHELRIMALSYLKDSARMSAVSDIICLADTGVVRVTRVEKDDAPDIKLPDDMPENIREAIIEQNRISYKFMIESDSGDLVEFNADAMSDGTIRLLEVLPVILNAFESGRALLFDEMDAHFHTHLLSLILRLFNDPEINSKGSQIIFTTHDTNVLDSELLRRDQIWFVSKKNGASSLKSLDEYDKKYIRPDSPFESFYMDGRLGALPTFQYSKVKSAILAALRSKSNSDA